jgi:hypothetical protein
MNDSGRGFAPANHRFTVAVYLSITAPEVYYGPDLAAHCHTLEPQVGGFSSDLTLVWLQTNETGLTEDNSQGDADRNTMV